MKQQLTATLLFSVILFSCDDDVMPEKVPLQVRQNLLKTFPMAYYIEWEKSGKDFEADFTVHAAEHSALFRQSGQLMQYKQAIPATALPEAVSSAIAAKHPGYMITEVDAVVKGDVTCYQVVLRSNTAELEAVFSADGQTLRQPYWD
ncbi:hypothetical protein [Pontibacter ramchanderi]|uniref:Uncharacterized protein n=1 Tax=Pontibacter ramchanderi TaxID=1179743 RepID=A0A2N3UDK0_9BACT|nr:hypothetical protein [Pontibacter ramchanderi]PKV67446.1 hypothetical protein BD749_2590 [Pontibacter ramchanderi]